MTGEYSDDAQRAWERKMREAELKAYEERTNVMKEDVRVKLRISQHIRDIVGYGLKVKKH